MKCRRGASLVELMVIISACSVILSLSGVFVRRAMLAQAETRSFFNVERTIVRLSNQFRQDVHLARAAVTEKTALDQEIFLRLELPAGQQVEYRRQDKSIQRLMLKDKQVQARDEFFFPSITELTLREKSSPPRLILSVTAEPDQAFSENDPRRLNIRMMPVSSETIAVLGRDWRFAHFAAGQKP